MDEWMRWARGWMSGEDRSVESARAARDLVLMGDAADSYAVSWSAKSALESGSAGSATWSTWMSAWAADDAAVLGVDIGAIAQEVLRG